MKHVVFTCFVLLALILASMIAVGWILGRPVESKIGGAPADLNGQSVIFRSDSGADVHGWWCPTQDRRGAVLLLPGIRANRLSMVDRARFLRNAGYSVLLIDFQATGETKGDHITFGWKESRDVLAAVNFIRLTDPTARIGIIGSSLGGAATLLATPPLKVNAVVLEAVYPTIEIATSNRLQNYLGAFGRAVQPLLLSQLHPRLGISVTDLRPIDHIANVHCPLLIVGGASDRNTRRIDTERLFAAGNPPKSLWLVPNAGHVDLHHADTAEYESRVLAFFQKMQD